MKRVASTTSTNDGAQRAPRRPSAALVGAALVALSVSSVQAEDVVVLDSGPRNVPIEYVVERGDTLWDICAHFFGEPRVWPGVWALNPHVTNPHWIYPGDVLRLRLDGGQQPPSPGGYTVGAQAAMQVGLNEGYIEEDRLETAGTVANSPEPRRYLAERDRVYLRLKKLEEARVGTRFTVFRVVNDVVHPETDEIIGRKIQLHGVVEVTAIDAEVATASVVSSFNEIERGMFVVPELDHHHVVSPKQNLIDLTGTVVTSMWELAELGQFHVVFLDRGSKDGVQVGNRFFVMRRGDGFLQLTREEDRKLPWEQIGEVLVLETRDRNSTALITRSALEIRKGDRVVMQRHY